MAPGTLMLEVGAVDWSMQQDAAQRTEFWRYAQTLLRFGVDERTELQAGWTAYGDLRVRDKTTGDVTHISGYGDLRLAVQHGLGSPNGPVAAQLYVALPLGTNGIGDGYWATGLLLPMSFALNERFSLGVTPEADAAVNRDWHGRHLAFGGAVGVGANLGRSASVSIDVSVFRIDDSLGDTTVAKAGLAFALQPGENTQLDISALAGLNRDSPAVELVCGVAHRF